MARTNAELHEALNEVAQSLLRERAKLNRLCSIEKAEGGERQDLLNRAATLVDDCAGALEELSYDLED